MGMDFASESYLRISNLRKWEYLETLFGRM